MIDAIAKILSSTTYGIGLIGMGAINAWTASENRKASALLAQENREHSEKMQVNQMKFSILQQKDMQEFQRDLAEFNGRNAKEIEAFRQSVAIAINQKNLDLQKWRFEQEKQLQYEMLMLTQDFQREYLQTQHQNSLTQIRERLRQESSPIVNLASDLLETSYINGVMPLKVLISPPILDYDSHRPQSSGAGYESLLAEEIRQFLHQGYLNSNQYPIQLLDKAWSSKSKGGGSAVLDLYAKLKAIPVLLIESEIVGDGLNLRVGFWSGGNAAVTEFSVLSRFPVEDLLSESAKQRALAWKETRQKLQARGKTEEEIRKIGDLDEVNLRIFEERTELEEDGINIPDSPVYKYKFTGKDYENLYEFLGVWHCLLIGVFADTLFLSRSWENKPLLPTLFSYLLHKYQDNQFPPEFWHTAITEIVTTYDQFYSSLKSKSDRLLPEMKMDFAEVLAQLPSEYHYLALQQGNSAVASWLKLNGVAGDKVFDVNNDEDCQLLKSIVYQEDEPFFRSLQELSAKFDQNNAIDATQRQAINSLLVGWQFLNRWGDIPQLVGLEAEPEIEDKIKLESETSIYYSLESFLSEGKWREADEETTRLMLQLGDKDEKGYLDIEDCQNFPKEELRTIDRLWLEYSEGKFGFSVQKRIYLQVGGKLNDYNYDSYEKMSDRIGWRKNNSWLSYSDLTLNITAPQGHFPFSGVVCFGGGALGVTLFSSLDSST